MDPRLAADLAALPQLLADTERRSLAFLDGLGERPVVPAGPPPEPVPLPPEGNGAAAALAEFAERWEPALSASAGSRYLGFVTGGATPAALAGDWLTAAADQNPVSSLDPAGIALERETTGWLRSLLGLPEEQRGTFVSGATLSNTVGLATAREWLGERHGVSAAHDGLCGLPRPLVLSGSPHTSVAKALATLGIGRGAVRPVPRLPGREAVDPEALERELAAADGPCIVVANAGTVDTVDFDDLQAIATLRERYGFWLHTDAAFGAFAALSPEHAHLVDGLGAADSVCVDLHKWLNVPYDSAVAFTRRRDLQARAFRASAAYLGTVGDDPEPLHLSPDSSRRMRALAAWCTLRAYGRDGHREIVERCVRCARALGDAVAATPGLRLLAPVRLNVACFTLEQRPTAERLAALAGRVRGEVFLTPTTYGGTPALRAAFSNWRTGEDDVARVARALRGAVSAVGS